MKNENEIEELKSQLEKLTGFIADYGSDKEFGEDGNSFTNNLCDSLSWVLDEISTEDFMSIEYLNISKLQEIVKNIEVKSGKKLADYE